MSNVQMALSYHRAKKKAYMTKIHLELTEDQVSKIIGALERDEYDDDPLVPLDDYCKAHNAFIRRLADKLRKARAKTSTT